MALRKIIRIEGEAFVASPGGKVSLGHQKTAFSAYCKIITVSGGKTNGRVNVECVGDNFRSIEEYDVQFSVADDAPNFIKQAYLQLKALPEWADATDC